VTAEDRGLQIALSTELTDDLIREGMARDFVRQVQQLRKEADLEIEDHIQIFYQSGESKLKQALDEYGDYIRTETLADTIQPSAAVPPDVKSVSIGDFKVSIWITKV
jgi:isoleucyl-tRNA synthetase